MKTIAALLLLSTLTSVSHAAVVTKCSATNGYARVQELVLEEKSGQVHASVGFEGAEEMQTVGIKVLQATEQGVRYLMQSQQSEDVVYVSVGTGPKDKKALATVISSDLKQISILKCK